MGEAAVVAGGGAVAAEDDPSAAAEAAASSAAEAPSQPPAQQSRAAPFLPQVPIPWVYPHGTYCTPLVSPLDLSSQPFPLPPGLTRPCEFFLSIHGCPRWARCSISNPIDYPFQCGSSREVNILLHSWHWKDRLAPLLASGEAATAMVLAGVWPVFGALREVHQRKDESESGVPVGALGRRKLIVHGSALSPENMMVELPRGPLLHVFVAACEGEGEGARAMACVIVLACTREAEAALNGALAGGDGSVRSACTAVGAIDPGAGAALGAYLGPLALGPLPPEEGKAALAEASAALRARLSAAGTSLPVQGAPSEDDPAGSLSCGGSGGGTSSEGGIPALLGPPPGTPNDGVVVAADEWRCHACTVLNAKDSRVCTCCGEQALDEIELAAGEWRCKSCTVVNSIGSTSCGVCELPR